MSSFYLKILASNKVFFSGKADILVVPGLDGEIAIMAHHQNMAIATTIGDVRFKPEGSEEYVDAVVGIGFVYIANNRVTMIVDTAERPEDIDEVRAKAGNGTCQGAAPPEAEHTGVPCITGFASESGVPLPQGGQA